MAFQFLILGFAPSGTPALAPVFRRFRLCAGLVSRALLGVTSFMGERIRQVPLIVNLNADVGNFTCRGARDGSAFVNASHQPRR